MNSLEGCLFNHYTVKIQFLIEVMPTIPPKNRRIFGSFLYDYYSIYNAVESPLAININLVLKNLILVFEKSIKV